MLTSVKVQFGVCLVDCAGITYLLDHSFVKAEEDFKAIRETRRDAGKRQRCGRAHFSTFGGMQRVSRRRAHSQWPRPAAELSCSRPSRARDRRQNQTHQRWHAIGGKRLRLRLLASRH
jgi:hypothetical protein